jgi:hypothetical protein
MAVQIGEGVLASTEIVKYSDVTYTILSMNDIGDAGWLYWGSALETTSIIGAHLQA